MKDEVVRLMGIIRGVRFGVNEFGQIGLSFGLYLAEGLGSPQFLPAAQAVQVIEQYGVGDVSRLDGKPCWARVRGFTCMFDAPCLI